MTDEELARMNKNLKEAFEKASDTYEYISPRRQWSPDDYRKASRELAQVSAAYLAADAEQRRRREEEGSRLDKTPAPKRPSADK